MIKRNKISVGNNKKRASIIIGLLVFTLILLLNMQTLYISDDFLYKFEFETNMPNSELQPVDGLWSIIKSQINHYFIWNGRFVAHTIIQIFMQYNKMFFNIANSFVYIFLGYLILKIGMKVTDIKFNALVLLSIYIMMFLEIPNFGQTVLWISGSGNYLWMSIIYLGYFYYNISDREDNWKTITAAIILGFLSGATNENNGPATIVMVSLIALYRFIKTKKIDKWRIFGILFSIIGFLMILFAPAATKRVNERNEISMSLSAVFDSMIDITKYIFDNYLIFIVVILLLMLILYKYKRLTEEKLSTIIILIIGFFAASYSLSLVGKIIPRTFFGPTIILITITSLLLLEFFDFIKEEKLITLSIVPLICISVITYGIAFSDINNTYQTVKEQYDIILSNPNEDVEVPMIDIPTTDYNAYNNGTNYLKENNDAWLNEWASRFFGVKSIGGY